EGLPPGDVRDGSMLSKKGFAKDRRAISIQDQAQIRNLDSKKGMPRFDNFKIQFYSSILDTFSTASVNHVVRKCVKHFRFTPNFGHDSGHQFATRWATS